MAIIPVIFFLCLTIIWWKQHQGFDVCTYMSSLYFFCSLSALLLIAFNEVQGSGILWDGWNVDISFLSTISYCIGIGVCLYPFSYFERSNVEIIKNQAPNTLLAICLLLIGAAIINFYCVADSTLDVLSGDLKELRDAHYEGDLSLADIKADSLPFIGRFIRYFNAATILALPITFYNVCFEKYPLWWNLTLFVTSLTQPLASFQMADRTELIFYFIMFIYCILFFYKFFTRRFKIILALGTFVLGLLASTYIIAVSAARFEDTDNGTSLSMFQYGGQGYLNWCYFCENASFDEVTTEREFPMTNFYLFNKVNDSDRRAERSAKEGFFISVFASFLGDIMLDLTPIGACIWVTVFITMTCLVINRKKRKDYNVSTVLALFILSSIPLFGVFYYRYWTSSQTYIFMLIGLLWYMERHQFMMPSWLYNSHKDDNENKKE